MSTTPTPISITISDPVLAAITASMTAAAKFCDLLATPEGQKLLSLWVSNGIAFQKALSDGIDRLEKFFEGK